MSNLDEKFDEHIPNQLILENEFASPEMTPTPNSSSLSLLADAALIENKKKLDSTATAMSTPTLKGSGKKRFRPTSNDDDQLVDLFRENSQAILKLTEKR